MRQGFEQQLSLGTNQISETVISHKFKGSLTELLAALLKIYVTPSYNRRIFQILNDHINKGKKQTGRPGMNLWIIFVLAQVRLCENISYDKLHEYANNHYTLRSVLGVNGTSGNIDEGFRLLVEFEYQNIYDNVSALSEEILKEINAVIVEFGHREVF